MCHKKITVKATYGPWGYTLIDSGAKSMSASSSSPDDDDPGSAGVAQARAMNTNSRRINNGDASAAARYLWTSALSVVCFAGLLMW